jgi:hypothetical protein
MRKGVCTTPSFFPAAVRHRNFRTPRGRRLACLWSLLFVGLVNVTVAGGADGEESGEMSAPADQQVVTAVRANDAGVARSCGHRLVPPIIKLGKH